MTYWISPTALSITPNALGEANKVLASVVSNAQVLVCDTDVRELNPAYTSDHNYPHWPLTAYPTQFSDDLPKYVHIAIPRTASVGRNAVVVFPSQELDIYGREVLTDESVTPPQQIGSTDYYYVYLQGWLTAPQDGKRAWGATIQTGTLRTDSAYESGSLETEWYRWDKQANEGAGLVTFKRDIDLLRGEDGKPSVAFQVMRIGNAILQWNGTANALEVVNYDDALPAHLTASGDVVALGHDPEGGGGGGGGASYFSELLDVIDAGEPNSATPYWGWNGTKFGWIAGDGKGIGSVSWNDISGKPSTLAGYGITADDALVSSIKDYATGQAMLAEDNVRSWVSGLNYITADALLNYATMGWVGQRGYITSAALNGYATEAWVTQRGYISETDAKAIKVNAAAAADHLSTSRTLWGQSFDGTQNISGLLSDVNDIMFKANGGEDKHIIGRSANGVYLLFNQGSDNFGDMLQLQNGASSVFMFASAYVNNNRKPTLITRADIQCQDHNVQIVRGRIGINAAPDSNYALKADGNGYFTGDLRGNKFMFHGDSRIWLTGGNVCFDKTTARECTWNVMLDDNTTKALTVIPLRTIKGVDTSAVVVYDRLSVGQGLWDGYKFDVDGDTNLRGSLRIGNIVLSNDGNKLMLTNITTGQMAHFCASGDVVAFGSGTSEGGGSGAAAYLHELLDVDIDNSELAVNDMLLYNGTKWGKRNLKTILNGYVSQSQISGYATVSSLADYAKVSALNGLATENYVQQYVTASAYTEEDVEGDIIVDLKIGGESHYLPGTGMLSLFSAEVLELIETKYSDVVTAIGVENDSLVWYKGGVMQDSIEVPYAGRADCLTDYEDDGNKVFVAYNGPNLTSANLFAAYTALSDGRAIIKPINKANISVGSADNASKFNGKADSAFVHIAGAETITGVKTFYNGATTSSLLFYANDKVAFDGYGNLCVTSGNWYVRGNSAYGNPYGVTLATQLDKKLYLGIHTTTPQHPLDINGNARIGGEIYVGTYGAKIWYDPTTQSIRTNCHIIADGDVVALGGIGTDRPVTLDTLNVASEVNIGSAFISFSPNNEEILVYSNGAMFFAPQGNNALEIEPWGIRPKGLKFGDNGAFITDISIKTDNGQEYLYITANGKQYKFKPA